MFVVDFEVLKFVLATAALFSILIASLIRLLEN
jgi:hypothetical protein